MKIAKIKYLFLFIFLLFGCAQKVSTYDTGYGLVAVPYNYINSSGYPPLSKYEFRSSTDPLFSVKIEQDLYSNDVSISEPIIEGKYIIDTLIVTKALDTRLLVSGGQIVQKIEVPFEIYVYDGEIVLIPYVFKVEQFRKNDAIYSNPSTVKFDDELQKFYLEKLKNRENIGQWKIRVL